MQNYLSTLSSRPKGNSKLKVTKSDKNQNAIVLHRVSKKYTLTKERPLLLKNLFIPSKKEEIFALKDVSLTIKKGETIGIIGENGSGKSTLLKIISGITSSTSGSLEINGRVASLIELGAGFHPDLTGKENVYLNATLLGLTKKEIDRKYREIVEFADIGEFIDQPVRTYSSGMTVRLGFSVAVHMDPDILLIDEVLAVGDEQFQRKSLKMIKAFQIKNKTLFIVSHNIGLINSICNTTILIANGKLHSIGQTHKIIRDYYELINKMKMSSLLKDHKRLKREQAVEIIRVIIKDANGKITTKFKTGEKLFIDCIYKKNASIIKPNLGISLYDSLGEYIFGTSTEVDNFNLKLSNLRGKVRFILNTSPLLRGYYSIGITLCENKNWYTPIDQIQNAAVIKLVDNNITEMIEGIVNIEHEWQEKQ